MKKTKNGILYKKLYKRVLIGFYLVFVILTFFMAKRHVEDLTGKSREVNNSIAVSLATQLDKNLNVCFKLMDQLALNSMVEQFASSDINYYSKIQTYNEISKHTLVLDDMGAQITLFKPGCNDYINCSGIYHDYNMKFDYGYVPVDSQILDSMDYGQIALSEVAENSGNDSKYINFICKRYTLNMSPVYFLLSVNRNYITELIPENAIFSLEITDGEKSVYKYSGAVSSFTTYTENIKSSLLYNRVYKFKFNLSVNYFTLGLLISLIFILFFCIRFVAKFFTNMIYSPINDIIVKISDQYYDDPNDEMTYINERFSSLSGENMLMKKHIELNERWKKNQCLKDAVYGYGNLSESEIKYFSGKMVTFVLYEILSDVENIDVIDYLLYEKEITETVKLNDKQFIILENESSTDRVIKRTNTVLMDIEKETGVECIAVVPGKYVNDVSMLNEVYFVASTMLLSRGTDRSRKLLGPDDCEEIKIKSYYYPFEIEKSVIENAVRGKFDIAMNQIASLLEENLCKLQLSSKDITEFKFAIVATMKRLINALGKQESDIFSDGTIIYVELNFAKSSLELKEKITEMFDKIFKACETNSEESPNQMISGIIDYINENYENSESLTLINVAQKFNITTGYLSMIFKNETGVNFRDYVIKVRMEKAKELILGSSELKIKQIANMVGYDNPNSFIRTFKKYEGTTPQMYRKEP